jgi:5-methylcytosine-specific restriction endonuclease McrA
MARAISQRRRARKAAAEGNITGKELTALRAKYGKKCAICGAPGRMTIDHIRPLALGGGHTANNIQFLCGPCNTSKGAKDPIAWAQSRGLLL